jgi:uncharacterized membrane protein YhaH (DUF805 family)/Tfp pilus assembly major pilin PilA
MQNRNPYAAPQTNVTLGESDVEEYGEIKVFSATGRIGRVRYIGYTTGLSILVLIAFMIVAGVAAAVAPAFAVLVVVLMYIALYGVQILLGIQRAHDMDTTGWLSLIIFVPLAALVFWFVPGTVGENRYGKQPPPNTTGAIVLACLPLPLVAMIGILAAIAIPAYQDYTIRAQVTEGLNLAAGPKAAVVEAFRRDRAVPADRIAAGLSGDATNSAGLYVDSVDVVSGTIVVTYGANANQMIAGTTLAIQPYVMPDESIAWRCAHGAPPGGGVAMDAAFSSADVTDIETRYLPSACRP